MVYPEVASLLDQFSNASSNELTNLTDDQQSDFVDTTLLESLLTSETDLSAADSLNLDSTHVSRHGGKGISPNQMYENIRDANESTIAGSTIAETSSVNTPVTPVYRFERDSTSQSELTTLSNASNLTNEA